MRAFLLILFIGWFGILEGQELVVQTGPISDVNAVTFSPDGRYVLSGNSDGVIEVWEASTGRELRIIYGHEGEIYSVSWSPDGRYFASGGKDKTVKVWDVTTGEEVFKLTGHTGYVKAVSFSPDSHYLLSGNTDKSIRIWDVRSGQEIRKITGHGSTVSSVSYDKTGDYIISGSWDKTIRVWSVKTGLEVKQFNGHTDAISSVSVTDKGLLASCSDKVIKVWNLDGGQEMMALDGDGEVIDALAFDPVYGRYLASAGRGEKITIWDIETGKEWKTLRGHTSFVQSLSFSKDGKYLASGCWGESIRVWDVEAGKEVKAITKQIPNTTDIVYSTKGHNLALSNTDQTIRIWNVIKNMGMRSWKGHYWSTTNLDYSPDNNHIASGGVDKKVRIWDVKNGKQLKVLGGLNSSTHSVNYDNEGRYLASAGDSTIKIWDVETGLEWKTLEGHTDYVYALDFSPDNRYLASGGSDKTVKIWDVRTGETIKTLKEHTSSVKAVNYSNDGKYLASVSWDNTIKIWDVKTWALLRTLRGHSWYANCGEFSPDSRFFVSGSYDKTIKIWDVETGEELKTFSGHTDFIDDIVYSSDGSLIISTCRDNRVKVWNAASGALLYDLVYFLEKNAFAVSAPDGRYYANKAGLKHLHYSDGLKSIPLPENDPLFTENLLELIISEQGSSDTQRVKKQDNAIHEELGVPVLHASLQLLEPSGNKLLDARESASIQLKIKNKGLGTARKVKISIQSPAIPHLNIDEVGEIDVIGIGKEAVINIPIEAGELIETRQVQLQLSFQESRGYPPAPINIEFGVQGLSTPNVQFIKAGIEELQGNGNNIIENAEVIKVTAVLKNKGELTARSVLVEALIGDRNINVLQKGQFPLQQNIGNLKPNESKEFQFVFSLNNLYKGNELPIRIRVKESIKNTTREFPLNLKMQVKSQAAQNVSIAGRYGQIGNRKNYAVFFAVSDYTHMTYLDHPVADAKRIAEELRNNYGFITEVLENPSLQEIINKIKQYEQHFRQNTNNQYGAESQLLFYFTGHGAQQYKTNGYFMPKGAKPDNLETEAFGYPIYRPRIDNIKCDHILVMIDACYSGLFAERSKGFTRPGELSKKEQFLQGHLDRISRLYMTSGAIEKTPDNSKFARYLLEGLQTKPPQFGFWTAGQLYENYIKQARPVPLFDGFGKNEGGSSFIFERLKK
jgi:WD40 repeat protein